ncbi:alpha/beta fold hydrolase [Halovulum sp. GXIMD14793]
MKQDDVLGLMLLHALPFDGRMWKNQSKIIPEHTYAPDLYVFGDNITRWAIECPRSMPTRRFVVVGCSVGGSCALEVLNLAPERVMATVLFGTKARRRANPTSLKEECKFIKDKGVSAAWARYWKPLFEGRENDSCFGAAEAIALAQSREGLTCGLKAFHTRPNREDVVAKTQRPIHIVTGDEDVLPGLDYSQELATLTAEAKLHVIRDCGHYAPLMQPEETNSLIASVVSEARKLN